MDEQAQLTDWVVIDDDSAKTLWERLLNGVTFVAADEKDPYSDWLKPTLSDGTFPAKPKAILIHADLRLADSRGATDSEGKPILTGIDWALRLRQGPDRFHCPIILVSFQRQEDAEADDAKEASDGLLKDFLAAGWQARWVRLPLATDKLRRKVQRAIRDVSVKGGISAKVELRDLATHICKRMIERKHRVYRHGRGGFTTAIWLLAGALQAKRAKAISLKSALNAVEGIKGGHVWHRGERRESSETEKASHFYDFDLVERYFCLITRGSRGKAAEAESSKRLLIVEDEYGWTETLKEILGNAWVVTPCKEFAEVQRQDVSNYHLVFVDENLGAESGLDVIEWIRQRDPLVPVILFTSNRNPLVTVEALEHGASDVLLKQSSDSSDRDALGYYKTCRAIIDDHATNDVETLLELRRAWAKATAMERALAPAGKTRDQMIHVEKALHGLQRAIILTAIAAGAAGPDRHYDTTLRAAVVQLDDALRDLATAFGATREDHTKNMLRTAFGTVENWLKGFALRANNCRHKARRFRNRVKGAKYCRLTADFINRTLIEKRLLTASPTVRVSSRRAAGPRTPPSRTSSTHETRSQHGAIRFFLGHYLLNGGSHPEAEKAWGEVLSGTKTLQDLIKSLKPPRSNTASRSRRHVLVVDDHARSDGWIRALRSALAPRTVECFAESAKELFEEIDRVKVDQAVMLLDLRLPLNTGEPASESVGLECMGKIREKKPDLPVVVFSATEGAFWARRCLRETGSRARAQAYFQKTGAPLPTAASASSEFFTGYFECLRDLLDMPFTVVSRHALDAAFNEFSTNKRFRFLDELPKPDRDRLRKELGKDLGLETHKHGRARKLSAMVADFMRSELEMVRALAWIAEDPSRRLLAKRLFPANPRADTLLAIVPTGPIETLVRIIFAVAWGKWPKDATEWQKDLLYRAHQNRGYFTHLCSDEFDRAWQPVFEQRNVAYHGDGGVVLEKVAAPYCEALKILCRELETAVDKVRAGPTLGEVEKYKTKAGEWKALQAIHQQNKNMDGKVLCPVLGGYLVAVGNVPARLKKHEAVSDSIFKEAHDPKKGETRAFRIVDMDDDKGNVEVSERPIRKDIFWRETRTGDQRRGIVWKVQDDGAVVDLGGPFGFLPKNQISNQLKLGEKIDVKVIKMDRRAEKIILSQKGRDRIYRNQNSALPTKQPTRKQSVKFGGRKRRRSTSDRDDW